MSQVERPVKDSAQPKSDGRDRQRRDFPPLRGEPPTPQETEAFRSQTFDRHHEVLSELADS